MVAPGQLQGEDVNLTSQSILQLHAKAMLDKSADHVITTERGSVWPAVIAFYKETTNPHKLQKNLIVNFAGEVGADVGGPKKEFFELALKEANDRLFKGKPGKRLPKKGFDFEKDLEIVGKLIAHSVLQGGPGFPFLSQALYYFISKCECYPDKEDH